MGGDRRVLHGAEDLRAVAQAERPGARPARTGASHHRQPRPGRGSYRGAGDGTVRPAAGLRRDDEQQVRFVAADRAIDPLGQVGGAVPVQPAVAVVRDGDRSDTEDRRGELDFPRPHRLWRRGSRGGRRRLASGQAEQTQARARLAERQQQAAESADSWPGRAVTARTVAAGGSAPQPVRRLGWRLGWRLAGGLVAAGP